MTDIHVPGNTPASNDKADVRNATLAPLVYPAKPDRGSRRFKGADEIDIEYAEEFEDAFYGEGM